MIATSNDPLLLNWDKSGPLNTNRGDSDIWKEDNTYYGLIGGRESYYPDSDGLIPHWFYKNAVWPKMTLWSSKDLINWVSEGSFLYENTPFTQRYDDGSCPNFQKIGDKHILLFFSHSNGGQYFLGDYDKKDHKFKPYDHGRFNHGRVAPGGVHAPSAASGENGSVINIMNINDGKQSDEWDQIMSLPQQLTLDKSKALHISPIEATKILRKKHAYIEEITLPANKEVLLESIKGNTIELFAEIDPKLSRWVQLNVLRSPNAEEKTSITFYNYDRKLTYWYDTKGEVVLDGTHSSILKDVWLRPPERAIMERKQETLKLRIFIDRSVIEVFVNGRQYLAMRVYPGLKESIGVSLLAQGSEANLIRLDAWEMKGIF